ncbi:MAG: hypothetical protein ACFFCZ_23205 [Promethearchaeota archaeon]
MSRLTTVLTLAIFLLSIVLLQITTPLAGIEADEVEGKFTEWEILEYNDAFVGSWYALDYSLRGKWAVKTGDSVNFTISKYNESNYGDPFNGTVAIGNFTADVPISEVAMSLILSIYPWNPGLITHTNWTWHREQATAAAEGTYTLGTIQFTEESSEYLGLLRDTIKFEYVQDPTVGNQNTTLVYDIHTGLLLYADTELDFGTPYKFTIRISETEIITATATPGFGLVVISLAFSILTLVIVQKKRKQRH